MIVKHGVGYNKHGVEDNQTWNRRKHKMEQKISKHGVGDNKHEVGKTKNGVEDNKILRRL